MSTADKPLSNVKTYFFKPIIETLCTFLKMVNLCGWENIDALLGQHPQTELHRTVIHVHTVGMKAYILIRA